MKRVLLRGAFQCNVSPNPYEAMLSRHNRFSFTGFGWVVAQPFPLTNLCVFRIVSGLAVNHPVQRCGNNLNPFGVNLYKRSTEINWVIPLGIHSANRIIAG